MIDLHTHTTASDGRCAPEELVARASRNGVTVLGLTDHDTIAGCDAAEAACAGLGIRFIPGIEVTAVADERDIHVLAYFFDPASPVLTAFLVAQRQSRVARVREMFSRLASHGIHLDVDRILAPGLDDASRAVGRPWIARAMVDAGYVSTVNDAFAKWLGRGCPAFVPRTGASPESVIATIHECGGLASLAHPVLVEHDEWIPRYAEAGLDALEAFHSDHTPQDTARYLVMARELGLRVTGGSDFHGDNHHGSFGPGSVTLPQKYWESLIADRSSSH